MCGIIGSMGNIGRDAIVKASKTIAHRGPDAFGVDVYKNVVLAHYRLSILDLSENGAQPYYFEHLTIVYNGEIYNYQTIRKELIDAGYSFNSDSDTEVIIKAFHCWGVAAVHRFAGMFAFAIHDRQKDELYLFRDRVGIKPLYYSLSDGLVFCSELRGIMPFLSNKEIDQQALVEYFRVGYISGDKTIYNQAKKLLPGHYLCYQEGKATIHPYWDIVEEMQQQKHTYHEAEWKELLHQEMIHTFSEHMVADVPVGVFLSGGIDSSLVTAILQTHYGAINTFTIGFDDKRYNEADYAGAIAKHLGTKHTTLTLELAEAKKILESFYDIYDEPFADSSGIPTTIVSKLAKQAGVKVVLSADGGDELFAGYEHYFSAYNLYNKLHGRLKRFTSIGSAFSGQLMKSNILNQVFYKNIEHKTATFHELATTKGLVDFYHAFLANQSKSEMDKLLKNQVAEKNYPATAEGITNFMLHDLKHYLPDDLLVKADRATMYNSIEGREPFLDHRLVTLAMQMPFDLKYRNGSTKWILKEILSDYVPRNYFERPKKGFSIPIFKWFSEELDKLFDDYLAPEKIKQTGLFHIEEVQRERKKYRYFKQKGMESNIEKMWRILSFMMWWEQWHGK